MDDLLAAALVNITTTQDGNAEYSEAFERAFELTRAYAGSTNAQASAIPSLFERLFELFMTGRVKN
ncbi:MAG: hypothetical protein ACOX5Z_07285 [Desulfobulbus sp.]